jgi:hypothetical protein
VADKSDQEFGTEGGESTRSEEGIEARKFPRLSVSFAIEYSGRSVRGTGTVRNISSSGALIENAEPLLLAGGEVQLSFSIFGNSLPITVPAKVVRETETGFGVEFLEMNVRSRKILKMAITKALNRPDQSEEDSTLLRLRRKGK